MSELSPQARLDQLRAEPERIIDELRRRLSAAELVTIAGGQIEVEPELEWLATNQQTWRRISAAAHLLSADERQRWRDVLQANHCVYLWSAMDPDHARAHLRTLVRARLRETQTEALKVQPQDLNPDEDAKEPYAEVQAWTMHWAELAAATLRSSADPADQAAAELQLTGNQRLRWVLDFSFHRHGQFSYEALNNLGLDELIKIQRMDQFQK